MPAPFPLRDGPDMSSGETPNPDQDSTFVSLVPGNPASDCAAFWRGVQRRPARSEAAAAPQASGMEVDVSVIAQLTEAPPDRKSVV